MTWNFRLVEYSHLLMRCVDSTKLLSKVKRAMLLFNRLGEVSSRAPWVLLTLMLCALGVLVLVNLMIEHGRVEARERDHLQAQANVLAKNMEHQIVAANAALSSALVELPSWRDVAVGNTHLKALSSVMPGVRSMFVQDASGRMLLSTFSEHVGQRFDQRDYFRVVRREPARATLYVSPPFKNVHGLYVMTLSRMVTDKDGKFDGVVGAEFDPAYFRTLMGSVLNSPDMWDALAHGNGDLFVIEPDRKNACGTNLAKPGTFFTRHHASGLTSTFMQGKVYLTGEDRMIAQRTVQPVNLNMNQPLIVAISRDKKAIYAGWRRDAAVQVGLYLLVVLCSTLGLYTFQRRKHALERDAAESRAIANRFAVALDNIPSLIYLKDRAHRYVYANRSTLRLFNRTEETIKGSGDAEYFPPDTVAHLREIDQRVLEQQRDNREEVVVRAPDGSERVYLEVKTPIFSDDGAGSVWGLCGISTDITESLQQRSALLESEARFQAVFESAAIGMALVDLDGRFLQVNQALCQLLGYQHGELVGKTFQEITHQDDLVKDLKLKDELLAGSHDFYQMEKRYFHRSGHVIWVQLNVAILRDAQEQPLYFITQIQNITAQKNMLEKLDVEANKDYLTGLNNRRAFMAKAETELKRSRRYGHSLSVFMIDIDHFKQINDTHGHKAGDQVLQVLGKLMRDTMRAVDVVGRIGGEEFAILLPETGGELASEVAERLRLAVEACEVVLEAGLPLHFTISVGIVTLRDANINLDMLLSQADQAMYQAKQQGRNRVCALG